MTTTEYFQTKELVTNLFDRKINALRFWIILYTIIACTIFVIWIMSNFIFKAWSGPLIFTFLIFVFIIFINFYKIKSIEEKRDDLISRLRVAGRKNENLEKTLNDLTIGYSEYFIFI